MFVSRTILFALAAFSYTVYAFNPLAFYQGLNSALGLQDNQHVNDCLYRFIMSSNFNTRAHITEFACYEAAEIYIRTFFSLAQNNIQGQNSEQLVLGTLDLATKTLENLQSNQNFAGGQNIATILKNLASIVKIVTHERFSSSGSIVIDTKAFLKGLNDELCIADNQEIVDCFTDSVQIDAIIRAIVVAMQENKIFPDIHELLSTVQQFSQIKSNCKSSLQALLIFVNPIEQGFKNDSREFLGTLKNNIETNPFGTAWSAIDTIQQLKSGNDYNAGRGLGQFLQSLLRGIVH